MIGLFNELLSLHPSANVWISLAMGKHFQLTVLMPSVHLLVLIHLELCPCCIPLLVVTPPLTSWAGERNPLRKLESRIVRLQMRSFILLITNINYHWDTEDPNFKLPERFQHGSLWQGKQWNIRKWSKNPGEYTTHTGNWNNPIFLVYSTKKITDMKI